MNNSDFRILEGLRGIAAFIVLLNHARGHLFVGGNAYLVEHNNWWDWLLIAVLQVTSLGPQAVIVFFVLSGLSIAHSIAVGGGGWGFYLRRVIRLYPPYLGGLVLAWLVYLMFRSYPVEGIAIDSVFENLRKSAENLLYLPNGRLIPQYWSLTHEVIFYFCAPLVATGFGWRVFLLVATGAYLLGWWVEPKSVLLRFLIDYMVYFAVGVAVYHRLDFVRNALTVRNAKFCGWLSCAFVLIIVCALKFSERLSFVLAALLSVYLIVNLVYHHVAPTGVEWLGKISYSLYVSHFSSIYICVFCLSHAGVDIPSKRPWLWVVSVPVALLLAFVFYSVFEKPSVTILKRWRMKRQMVLQPATQGECRSNRGGVM